MLAFPCLFVSYSAKQLLIQIFTVDKQIQKINRCVLQMYLTKITSLVMREASSGAEPQGGSERLWMPFPAPAVGVRGAQRGAQRDRSYLRHRSCWWDVTDGSGGWGQGAWVCAGGCELTTAPRVGAKDQRVDFRVHGGGTHARGDLTPGMEMGPRHLGH